jgi:hypothetical protein
MNFREGFWPKTQISNFMKNHSMGVEFFHADGRTDGRTDGETDRLDEADVAFRKFAIAPTKVRYGITYNMCSCVHIMSHDICARSCLLVRI